MLDKREVEKIIERYLDGGTEQQLKIFQDAKENGRDGVADWMAYCTKLDI